MSQIVECNHSLGNDPRRRERGECVKCGKVLGPGWMRDPDLEEKLIRRHTQHGEIADRVVAYMRERAGTDTPVSDLLLREFAEKEAPEEWIDAVFYLLAECYKRMIFGYEDELSAGQSMAMYHTIEAYRCILMDTDD